MSPVLALSDREFARLSTLVADLAGLAFAPSRRESLGHSLRERLAATGLAAVRDYLDLVAADAAEQQALLDELTVQETHFFRNPPQMRALRAHVLPQLLREAEQRGRRLRIWSAGCSTGEEPYTIAMMLRELLPSTRGWDVRVIGTDVSQGALAAARRATYGPRALQQATEHERERFFHALPDGRFEVRPEVRDLVELRHHNLVREDVVGTCLDLVLCRNVTIYFSRETTRTLVGRLHASLRDGGYLFLGHSETLWQVSEQFRLVTLGRDTGAAYVYRREDGVAAAPVKSAATAARVAAPRRTDEPARMTVAEPSAARAARPRRTDAPPTDARLGDVREALADGRYADAARLAALAATREPLSADAHYLLGRALVEQRQDVVALTALRRAVYLAPEAGLAHFLLAGALGRTGDPAAAAREYRAAAATLEHTAGIAGAPELGGRSARELARLCARLADVELPVRQSS